MQTSLHFSRPLAACFLSLSGPARGRGLFCFLVGLLLLGSPLLAQTITTVAGTGTGGFSGDGAAATAAQLNSPYGVAFDAGGNLFIADYTNNRIRKVDVSTGIITTVAGVGTGGVSGDGGLATAAEVNAPYDVAVDAGGNLFIVNLGDHRIRKVNVSTGIITVVAGTGTGGFSGDGGLATAAQLSSPSGIGVDAAGNLFIADGTNYRVRKVDVSTGIITTVAGTGGGGFPGFSGDGGLATAAQLSYTFDVAVDAGGNLFIADFSNNRIRKVTPGGIITTVAGFTSTGGFSGDGGPATAAQLNNPIRVAFDAGGNLFIGDSGNSRIRKVDVSTGIITTVAGTGTPGFSGDGGAATAAQLAGPAGVAFDAGGNLFIADNSNHRIRKVNLGLSLTTSASPNPTCTTTSMASVTASSGTAPYSYTWVAPAGVTLTGGSTSAASVSANAGVTGVQTLTVLVADAASSTATAQVSLTFSALSSFTVLGSGTVTCASSPTVTLSGSETGVSYGLRRDGTPVGSTVAGTGSALSFGPQSTSGVYTVVATNTATSCTLTMGQSATVTTTAESLPTASIAGNLAICGSTATTLTASGAGVGGSYRWSTNATSATTAAISVNTAGTYSVTVTTASGCTATNSRTTTARTLPMVSIAALPSLSVCAGQSLTLTANATAGVPTGGGNRIATVLKPNSNEVMLNVGPAFSYTWSTGSTLRTTSFTPTATTVVSVQVNDGFCTSQAISTTVSNLTSPVVSIGTSAAALGCGITSITLTANGPVGATYAWEDASSTPTRVISASGTYGLSATSTNGCSATATSVTIGTNSVLNTVITLVFNNSATVMGSGIPTITVPATPGQQFQAFASSGSGFEFMMVLDRINGYEIRQKDENNTGIFTIKQGGPFSITVRDGNGCSRTVQGVIVVRP